MGQLLLGDSPGVEFDDRLLAHLKVVVFSKFRRRESFAFSWDHGRDAGSGRSSIWLSEAVPVRFVFSGGKPPSLNRVWLERLMDSANSTSGLQITPEPEGSVPS